jgi:hypothetical protein
LPAPTSGNDLPSTVANAGSGHALRSAWALKPMQLMAAKNRACKTVFKGQFDFSSISVRAQKYRALAAVCANTRDDCDCDCDGDGDYLFNAGQF